MKASNRSNALLVELLIVVMFFMLSATVLLEVFLTARSQSVRAGAISQALNEAQSVADRLYAAPGDPAADIEELKRLGFDFDAAGGSFLERGEYKLLVNRNTEDREAGLMDLLEVQAYQEDKLLFTLPVKRYREAQP